MRDLPPEAVYAYACEDADITLRLYHILEPKLKEVGGEDLFWQIEMPLVPVLADMEQTGVCLDTEALKETSRIFNERLHLYETRIYEEAGETFNIASPKQVGEILSEIAFGRQSQADKDRTVRHLRRSTAIPQWQASHSGQHSCPPRSKNYWAPMSMRFRNSSTLARAASTLLSTKQ